MKLNKKTNKATNKKNNDCKFIKSTLVLNYIL